MTVKAGDLMGPRPGEHCILCGAPILVHDSYKGAKGDYAHARCADEQQQRGLRVHPRLQEIVYDKHDNEVERRSAQYDYEYQRGFKAGYDSAYEHGRLDGIRIGETENEGMLNQMRAILDKCQVPAAVDYNYGVGQAGRLAWLLDRLGYVIQEIGNPDALTEG